MASSRILIGALILAIPFFAAFQVDGWAGFLEELTTAKGVSQVAMFGALPFLTLGLMLSRNLFFFFTYIFQSIILISHLQLQPIYAAPTSHIFYLAVICSSFAIIFRRDYVYPFLSKGSRGWRQFSRKSVDSHCELRVNDLTASVTIRDVSLNGMRVYFEEGENFESLRNVTGKNDVIIELGGSAFSIPMEISRLDTGAREASFSVKDFSKMDRMLNQLSGDISYDSWFEKLAFTGQYRRMMGTIAVGSLVFSSMFEACGVQESSQDRFANGGNGAGANGGAQFGLDAGYGGEEPIYSPTEGSVTPLDMDGIYEGLLEAAGIEHDEEYEQAVKDALAEIQERMEQIAIQSKIWEAENQEPYPWSIEELEKLAEKAREEYLILHPERENDDIFHEILIHVEELGPEIITSIIPGIGVPMGVNEIFCGEVISGTISIACEIPFVKLAKCTRIVKKVMRADKTIIRIGEEVCTTTKTHKIFNPMPFQPYSSPTIEMMGIIKGKDKGPLHGILTEELIGTMGVGERKAVVVVQRPDGVVGIGAADELLGGHKEAVINAVGVDEYERIRGSWGENWNTGHLADEGHNVISAGVIEKRADGGIDIMNDSGTFFPEPEDLDPWKDILESDQPFCLKDRVTGEVIYCNNISL